MQDFQDRLIPDMFANIYPVFMTFSEDLEMMGLNIMQGNLSLEEGKKTNDHIFNPFFRTVFKLLSELINFRYSITIQ